MSPDTKATKTLLSALLDRACEPYRPAGQFAWRFARGKLSGDPAFKALLAQGLIPDHARVLDLGCGQGLLASWLLAARRQYEESIRVRPFPDAPGWPEHWPAAARIQDFHGVELMPKDVDRAQAALGGLRPLPRLTLCDICDVPFEPCDVVVILDVLHYIDMAAQDAVLTRVRDALAPNGVLLLRVGDASAGLPFKISNWVDHVVTFIRGHRLPRLYCRALTDWQAALLRLGFQLDAPIPLSQGTPFANVLLVARLG
ncbi:class I SAM-dependent methyltransferase [Aquabacterium sp.]|uniref:class I SAM-dependent methyltransferase n=1 Tax=Aquabacterium sp. TaxID=1872578 RepID=UPI00248984BC|nr:class I SAM-dependent methyltransferase [Aquabacterium sp.]MDI1258439.1 class I SAM-dependent methyltransferase [Aquabacterium sp.]